MVRYLTQFERSRPAESAGTCAEIETAEILRTDRGVGEDTRGGLTCEQRANGGRRCMAASDRF
jgi:hypothetical protein